MKIDFNNFDIIYTINNNYYECYIYDLNNVVKLDINKKLCKETDLLNYIKNNFNIFFYKKDDDRQCTK